MLSPLLLLVSIVAAASPELQLDLWRAVVVDDLQKARALVLQGADPTAPVPMAHPSEPALLHALYKGKLTMAELLLDLGADPRKAYEGRNALHAAARGDYSGRLVRRFIEAGLAVDLRVPGAVYYGMPLSIAALSGNAAAVRMLLAAGADPNVREGGRDSPFQPLRAAVDGIAAHEVDDKARGAEVVAALLRGNAVVNLLTARDAFRAMRRSDRYKGNPRQGMEAHQAWDLIRAAALAQDQRCRAEGSATRLAAERGRLPERGLTRAQFERRDAIDATLEDLGCVVLLPGFERLLALERQSTSAIP